MAKKSDAMFDILTQYVDEAELMYDLVLALPEDELCDLLEWIAKIRDIEL